jgi:hypothetical protein
MIVNLLRDKKIKFRVTSRAATRRVLLEALVSVRVLCPFG